MVVRTSKQTNNFKKSTCLQFRIPINQFLFISMLLLKMQIGFSSSILYRIFDFLTILDNCLKFLRETRGFSSTKTVSNEYVTNFLNYFSLKIPSFFHKGSKLLRHQDGFSAISISWLRNRLQKNRCPCSTTGQGIFFLNNLIENSYSKYL